jgi:hypothetical protein
MLPTDISVVLLIHKRIPIQWRSTASRGHSRRVFAMQVPHIQEKWLHAPSSFDAPSISLIKTSTLQKNLIERLPWKTPPQRLCHF